MRLIKFTTLTGRAVYINPNHVLSVLSAPDKGDMACAVTTTEVYRSEMAPHECLNVMYYFQGAPEEVAAKLMGESLVEEPERWVPKKGEKYWAIYSSNNIVRNVWVGDAIDRERLIQKRAFPHTDDGRLDAQKRVLELLEGK